VNRLFDDNAIKLGTFSLNGNGGNMVALPDKYYVTWPRTLNAAQLADDAGFEAIVPYARWKSTAPISAPLEKHGVLEPYTWAAGLGAATRSATIFSTSHVPVIHPIVAAKQCVTVDHITNGRFALNIVAGWNKPEFDMFGVEMKEHADRYAQAAEWIDIVKRLWTEEDEFDFEGRFYRIVRGSSWPKPIQTPFPPIMNAGGSQTGREFAAKYSDMCFVSLKGDDPSEHRAQIAAYRDLAWTEYKRELQVWTSGYVVQRDTQAEADAYESYLLENADTEKLANWTRINRENTQGMTDDQRARMSKRWVAGLGGYPLVGTPEVIVDRFQDLRNVGIDGVLCTWIDVEAGLPAFINGVLPLLEQAGLRKPFAR
jgi:alkanesulfonate monooxygenase SsuD/methylene tetrahydromethanopterin reductase-like flavin-dependent oxidoreductase (luciferase family)